MKTIGHLITGLEVGGAENILLATLPRINDQDLRHRVYCVRGHGVIGKELERKGIFVTYLAYQGFFTLPRTTWRLYRGLRRDHIQVLVTYLIHADLLGRVIGRIAGIRKIVSYKHGALLRWEFLRYADRMTSVLVDRYIAISSVLKDRLVHVYHIPPKKVGVIRNGVDLERFVPQGTGTEPSAFPKGDHRMVLGIVGALRIGKGHPDLLHALHRIKAAGEKMPLLLIVGEGDQRRELQELVQHLRLEHDVLFTGRRDDIPAILQGIDIFVLPTYFEGMSVALLEAMAAGRPIITTSIPENTEVLRDGETGILIKPGDIPALTGALLQLLRDKSLRVRLAQNARAECMRKYDITKTVDQFKTILLSI